MKKKAASCGRSAPEYGSEATAAGGVAVADGLLRVRVTAAVASGNDVAVGDVGTSVVLGVTEAIGVAVPVDSVAVADGVAV